MDFVERELLFQIQNKILDQHPTGIILPGIVGCGKTTLVTKLLEKLEKKGFDVLQYTGDDVAFRSQIRENTRFISNEIHSRGLKKVILFVDEIQKEPEIFDAVKIAYDEAKVSFIVSGSHPAFLKTEAKNRLQRRAEVMTLTPFSLKEILVHKKIMNTSALQEELAPFEKIIADWTPPQEVSIESEKWDQKIVPVLDQYLIYGGLPKAFFAKGEQRALQEIKLVAERGITENYETTVARDDEVRQYLASLNSKEFTYKGIHQVLRNSKRNGVDKVIDHLLNHGYLIKKRPYLAEYENLKKTYFAIYSWIDPSLVTYYTAHLDFKESEAGYRLEAYVHSRLNALQEKLPLKANIYYYKNFAYKAVNDSLDFLPGEIDFIFKLGERLVPIEVKKTHQLNEIKNTELLECVISKWKLPFGVVLYGGAPYFNKSKKILFYPFWKI